jgi:hypothetical protein
MVDIDARKQELVEEENQKEEMFLTKSVVSVIFN